MPVNEKNILIGGEAGQGLVTFGQLLGKALIRSGYEILVTQAYESRIRGGHNTFTLRVSKSRLWSPREGLDLLIALNAETVEIHRPELKPGGLFVADKALAIEAENGFNVPFQELAAARLLNTVALGAVGALLNLALEPLSALIEKLFGKKHPEVVQENTEALRKGYEWTMAYRPAEFEALAAADFKVPRMMMAGNEGIALGALSAGVKFCAFYPMTPATGVMLNIISHADRMGCIVEQAEDEIAAINMAIGASFAGAPSMVATAGGGFALMTEAVSLAAMTETPLVVVVGQRPGPATGLPTRTEQGDLDLVLHAGHGEFPRAILAPRSVESCYRLTRKAFQLAELAQGPIFILTDQYLADSLRAVEPFDVMKATPVKAGAEGESAGQPYKRYAITASGISPRKIPGASRDLVVADSDEHSEDGHITEDLTVRTAMVEKRLRKLKTLEKEIVAPEFRGEQNPDLLLVTWGSSRGAALEAAMLLNEQGRSVATLHFDQVWPLQPDQFLDILKSAKEVIGVENNATGQFARLIRRESGFYINRLVLRYDGLPLNCDYILRQL